jgi:hypothetical protein
MHTLIRMNWNKLIQPLIIGALIAWLVIQSGSNDTFIEDTKKETQDLRDALKVTRDSLYLEIHKKDLENDSLEIVNDAIDGKIGSIDNSVEILKNSTDEKIHYINSVDADGTVVILSGYLSEDDGD